MGALGTIAIAPFVFPVSFLIALFGGDKRELFALRRVYGLPDANELSADELVQAIRARESEGELTIASTGKDTSTSRLVAHEYRVDG